MVVMMAVLGGSVGSVRVSEGSVVTYTQGMLWVGSVGRTSERVRETHFDRRRSAAAVVAESGLSGQRSENERGLGE